MLALKNKQNWLTAVSLLFAFLSVHAATFTNDVLSANGEHGDQTVGISHFIFGENWTGSDGGVADESQLLVTHPDAYVSQIHSSGGAGVYYTGALQFGASNSTFTGGNSGRSIGVSEQADVYANGGMGASVSAPQGTPGELPPDQSSPPPPYDYGSSGAVITIANTADFSTNTTISSGTFSSSMNTLATENSGAYA